MAARLGSLRRGGEIRNCHHVGGGVALVQHEEHTQNDQQSYQTAHDGADDDLLLLACLRGLRTLFRTGFRGNAVLRVRHGLELACDGIERLRCGRFAGVRAFILVRSVNGLNAAAIGTPPFMNVSRSFLNSEAVA